MAERRDDPMMMPTELTEQPMPTEEQIALAVTDLCLSSANRARYLAQTTGDAGWNAAAKNWLQLAVCWSELAEEERAREIDSDLLTCATYALHSST